MITRTLGRRALASLIPIFLLAAGTGALAQEGERGSGTAVVAAFEKYCFSQPYTVSEITAGLSKDSSLRETALPSDFVVKDLGENQSWSLTIDGKPFQLIVIRRLGFKKSGIQCFLRTEENEGTIFPYFDLFRERMKANGLSGRETDLPGYYRASGKVADGRKVDARIITRSAWPTTSTNRYTTMAALYE
ncbi:hypothetical protein ACVWZA_002269 [Sphingomonas sp. UYAg733]